MANDGVDKLAKMLAETLPQSLRSMRDDLEENFRSVLQTGLSKLDLVTREEFEVQQAVLERAREKLEALDARLAEMESATPARKSATKKKAKKKRAGKKTAKKASKKKTKSRR